MPSGVFAMIFHLLAQCLHNRLWIVIHGLQFLQALFRYALRSGEFIVWDYTCGGHASSSGLAARMVRSFRSGSCSASVYVTRPSAALMRAQSSISMPTASSSATRARALITSTLSSMFSSRMAFSRSFSARRRTYSEHSMCRQVISFPPLEAGGAALIGSPPVHHSLKGRTLHTITRLVDSAWINVALLRAVGQADRTHSCVANGTIRTCKAAPQSNPPG